MILSNITYDIRDVQVGVPTPTLAPGAVAIEGPVTLTSKITGEVVGVAWDATAKVMHIIVASPTPGQ